MAVDGLVGVRAIRRSWRRRASGVMTSTSTTSDASMFSAPAHVAGARGSASPPWQTRCRAGARCAESTDAWSGFPDGSPSAGSATRALISDGAAGLINSIEPSYHSLRQNVSPPLPQCVAKVPVAQQESSARSASLTLRLRRWHRPRPDLVGAVQNRIDVFTSTYVSVPSTSVSPLDRQLTASALPIKHHSGPALLHRRTFGSPPQSRSSPAPRQATAQPGSAVLDHTSRRWRGLAMTPAGSRLLPSRRQLFDPPTHPATNQHHTNPIAPTHSTPIA